MDSLTIKLRGVPVAKFSVEEVGMGFIATFWDMEDCLEPDRIVTEFETYSAARASMFEQALSFAIGTDTVLTVEEV